MPTVYTAAEYYPLTVGDWHDYLDSSGNVKHTSVEGVKLIDGIATKIETDWTGVQTYTASDQGGIKIYGQYDPVHNTEIIFQPPLLMLPPNPLLGKSQVSTASYTLLYSGQLYHVNVTSTVDVLGLDDVLTQNSILPNCLKVASRLDQYIVELYRNVPGASTYQWFYKGVGMVKQLTDFLPFLITSSFVDGVEQHY
jgi:hypothetical protein